MAEQWQTAFGVLKIDGFGMAPRPNIVRAEVEIGEGKERRQYTGKYSTMNGSRVFTRAIFNTFEAWYKDDIAEGVTPFEMTDPVRGDTGTFKLRSFRAVAVSGALLEVSFDMTRIA